MTSINFLEGWKMGKYKADNGKVVDTDKLDRVLNMDYDGCYGTVRCDLYRTQRTHNLYKVSESPWAGYGNISEAEEVSLEEVASLLAEELAPEEIKERYPEVSQHVEAAIDN